MSMFVATVPRTLVALGTAHLGTSPIQKSKHCGHVATLCNSLATFLRLFISQTVVTMNCQISDEIKIQGGIEDDANLWTAMAI